MVSMKWDVLRVMGMALMLCETKMILSKDTLSLDKTITYLILLPRSGLV